MWVSTYPPPPSPTAAAAQHVGGSDPGSASKPEPGSGSKAAARGPVPHDWACGGVWGLGLAPGRSLDAFQRHLGVDLAQHTLEPSATWGGLTQDDFITS